MKSEIKRELDIKTVAEMLQETNYARYYGVDYITDSTDTDIANIKVGIEYGDLLGYDELYEPCYRVRDLLNAKFRDGMANIPKYEIVYRIPHNLDCDDINWDNYYIQPAED